LEKAQAVPQPDDYSFSLGVHWRSLTEAIISGGGLRKTPVVVDNDVKLLLDRPQ